MAADVPESATGNASFTTPKAPQPTFTAETPKLFAPEIVRLRDGSRVAVRPVREQDEPALRSFFAGLCAHARLLRFFTGAADVTNAARVAASTGPDRYGVLAHDETGVLVGHALYMQLDATRAEVAVEVADHLHDRGLGTLLIERLACVAEERGITRFIAEVLPQNRQMLAVFRDGFDARVTLRDGSDAVEFPTSAWRTARERFSARK
ncbi:MAG: GNAT family N-acetyltransferase [Solirubrobacteraceae bacterium]